MLFRSETAGQRRGLPGQPDKGHGSGGEQTDLRGGAVRKDRNPEAAVQYHLSADGAEEKESLPAGAGEKVKKEGTKIL